MRVYVLGFWNATKCTLIIDQHARLDLKHPNGGRALYQEAVLYEKSSDYLGEIARTVLESGVDTGMTDVVEQFDKDSGEACPKELTLLAHSGHPRVTSNGATVYDRAPEVPRLSEAELRALHPRRPSQGGDINLFRRSRRRRG